MRAALAMLGWCCCAAGCVPRAPDVVEGMRASNRAIPAMTPDPPEPPPECEAAPDAALEWVATTVAPSMPESAPPPKGSCKFPNAATVDAGVVVVALRVDATGRVVSTAIACEAPTGHGFADSARDCASKVRFTPARDADGAAIASATTVRFRFTR